MSYTVGIRRTQVYSAKQAAKSGDERIVMLEGLQKTIGLQQKRQAIRRRHWRCLCPRYIADAFIELDTYCRNAFYQDVAIHKYVRCALDGIAINRNKSCPDGHQTQIAKRFPCRG